MSIKNANLVVYKNGRWLMGSGSGNIRDTVELTLEAANWSENRQVIPCNSVGSNSTVMPNPTAASKQAYIASGIMLTEAEVGKMVFECVVPPTEDIAVLVHIIDPLITAEPILTFDSVEEMNAYEAEDGAIAIVPSEGEEKVINLTQYATDDGTSYNDVLLMLFSQGGGKYTHNGVITSGIFPDITTDKELKFVFDGSALASGMLVEAKANSFTKVNGVPITLEFTFAIKSATWMRATVAFEMSPVSDHVQTNIYLILEELSVPNV
jgi:hypothetical protein